MNANGHAPGPRLPKLWRLRSAWAAFEQLALSDPAIPDVQRSDMRDAFYSGARVIMCAMLEVSDSPLVTDADVDILADLDAELNLFGKFIEERARARRQAREKSQDAS